MKKSYYYEFAIVVIISLLIIFSTFIIEKSLEKYQMLKAGAANGTMIVIQQASNYSNLQQELIGIKGMLKELYLEIQQLNVRVNNLSQEISNIKPVYKTIIMKQIYNYTYSYQLDERKLDLLLQYVESKCYTNDCQMIDSLLYQLYSDTWLEQNFPALTARLKSDLLILKHFSAEKDYRNKDMLAMTLNDTLKLAETLDKLDSSVAKDIAFKLFTIAANICRSYNKVISCAYIVYLPGQQINTSQYDVVALFNLENLESSPYLQYLVRQYNITTTPYYISF